MVWRGDGAARRSGIASNERLRPVVNALVALGVTAIPVIYRDEIADAVRAELLTVDGVLVWIDPIGRGEDRTRFDRILLDLSSAGVWVSAHPETIALIGTKDVLYTTRSLSWGSDVHRYATLTELQAQLPARLAKGPRVVKRQRGNAGIGVWKIEVPADSARPITGATSVLVHGAEHRDTDVDAMELAAFFEICAPYFASGGVVIDQAFQPRVTEGLVRRVPRHRQGGRILPTERGHTHHRRRERRPRDGLAVAQDDVPPGRARVRAAPGSARDRVGARLAKSPRAASRTTPASSGTPTSFSDHPQSTAPTLTCCARSTAAASRRSRPRRRGRSPAPRSTRSRRDGVRLRAVHSRRVACSSTRARRRGGRPGW